MSNLEIGYLYDPAEGGDVDTVEVREDVDQGHYRLTIIHPNRPNIYLYIPTFSASRIMFRMNGLITTAVQDKAKNVKDAS